MMSNGLRLRARLVLASAFICATACEETVGPEQQATALVAVSGDDQTTLPGGQVPRPLVVQALDSTGSPRAGVLVTWKGSAGSQFVADTSRTDAEGKAYGIWISGQSGSSFTATAQADSFAGATFRATTALDALTVTAYPDTIGFRALGDTATMRLRVRGKFFNLDTIIDGNGASWGPDAVVNPIYTNLRRVVFRAVKNGTSWQWVNFGMLPAAFKATVHQTIAGVRIGVAGTADPIPDTLTIGPEGMTPLAVTSVDSRGYTVVGTSPQANVTWQSANPGVAEITSDGKVIGVYDGVTTIIARYGGMETRTPVRVWSLNARGIAAGGGSACATREGGGFACWGFREVGNNSQLNVALVPEERSGPALTSLAMSSNGVCGLTAAGAAYCWGANQSGRLGNGTFGAYVASPTAVSGGIKFTSIAIGHGTTACGIAEGGDVYCWGGASEGILGNGTYGSSTCAQKSICSTTPEKVAGNLSFTQVAVGGGFACGIANDERAYCWGTNRSGQLGSPQTQCVGYPNAKSGTFYCSTTPVEVDGGRKYRSISAGAFHACAVTTDNQLYCWGGNLNGVIGSMDVAEGGNTRTITPVAVGVGTRFSAAFSGYSHSCAIDVDGAAWCWGQGFIGQLGLGRAAANTCVNGACERVPARVFGGLTFKSLAPGGSFTCGLTTDNVAYCWGWGGSGALGTGTIDNKDKPTLVALQRR